MKINNHVDFNPRSREGSDGIVDDPHPDIEDFNPRSREGSDDSSKGYDSLSHISIHAPAKGATINPALDSSDYFYISIHAPAKGATVINAFTSPFRLNFNPRSREGSDQVAYSISVQQYNFNPRSREGSDAYIVITMTSTGISIHAPAKGATTRTFE